VAYIIGVLAIIIIMLILYLIILQLQIRNINRQLDKRIKEHTRQPISLELINSELSKLAININQCLKAEENLRLNGVREEKKFREMIANISHDLRTPLTSIRGYQQLLEGTQLTEEQRSKLKIAMNRTEELGQLIEHFFEYSYLLNTEPEQHKETFNLTNLVTECLVASVTSLEEHNLTIKFDEDTPPIFLTADKEMVTRIVQNLIRNGIQHSAGEITVRLDRKKDTIISFQNPVQRGMEPDVNRLFERFYTGDNARSHSTGLGLSIVKLLVDQMGGSVAADLLGNQLKITVRLG
jgi:Signal transduction histidine kinase